jgi:hypothetical protein
MSGDREREVTLQTTVVPVLALACTTCELLYEPDPTAFGTGTTGCPRCGGWTWIAQLGSAACPSLTGPERPTPPPHTLTEVRPELTVRRVDGCPPGRVSPTTPTAT